MNIAIVGAGFSGAVIARELAAAGHRTVVFDQREHVAGNCHTFRDPGTGVLVHAYGPHIFHTDNETVWNYVRKFEEFMPFTNRVKAIARGRVYSMPVNLLTINQFFGRTFSPSEARDFIQSISEGDGSEPRSFEQQALRFVGRELYETFFKGYTLKQWGIDPTELPASILKRLPLRFNYDDNYYSSRYQGMPRNGYTQLVERILDCPGVEVKLGTRFARDLASGFDHVFYSGPLDGWFDFQLGRLRYRTLDFVAERHDGDFQGNAVINYPDIEVPFTRISEHKHFAPWEEHARTIIFREYSREAGQEDIPYYPIRLLADHALLADYAELARQQRGVTFVGRLGTYRYLDMHVTIAEALDVARRFLEALATRSALPVFSVQP